jgi:thiol-disulfide isomerase/thioredoxin
MFELRLLFFLIHVGRQRVAGEGEGPRVYVDLADKGALLSEEEALAKASKVNPALATEAGLRGLSHVQLYLCVMHEMVDFYSRVGDEGQLMAWLQQIRILQTAVSTLAVAEYEARAIDPANNAAEANTAGAEDGGSGQVQLLPPAQLFKSGKLRTAGGGEFRAADLEGKYVGLYFSASWCGPCKKFTPELIKSYCKMKMADGRPLEVVFVSSDRSADAFERYADTMPWPAVPFADEETRVQLAQQLGVSAIPMLVLVAPDGSVTTTEGHRHILTDPLGENFPWTGDSSANP